MSTTVVFRTVIVGTIGSLLLAISVLVQIFNYNLER